MSEMTQTATSLRVLLVEDHRDIAANICESFASVGHLVDYADSANHALVLLESARFDLLILDIMLPGQMNGITLCREIRHKKLSLAPILMLTARDLVDDKIAAFDAGADDYLTKPFSTRELLARARVLSRRQLLNTQSELVVGPIVLDMRKRSVERSGQAVSLTRIGYRILMELLRESPGVVLRDDLEHAVWGENRPDSDALRTHMSILRTALDKPFEYKMIQTMHGAGWKLVEPRLDGSSLTEAHTEAKDER